jgi:hypothetical protein
MLTSALKLYLARLRYIRSTTKIPSPYMMGAGWRLWRLSWQIVKLFWWHFVDSIVWVLRTLFLCALTITSAYNNSVVDLLLFPFVGLEGMHVR